MVTQFRDFLFGQQVSLPGHFDTPVVLEAARPLTKGFECRVRLPDGTLEEAVISPEEADTLAGVAPTAEAKTPLANAGQLRLMVESARIRLADTHDRQFAVSLSGRRVTTSSHLLRWVSCADKGRHAKPNMCGQKNNLIKSGAIRRSSSCRFLPDIAGFSSANPAQSGTPLRAVSCRIPPDSATPFINKS
jgi:hypothetical protein